MDPTTSAHDDTPIFAVGQEWELAFGNRIHIDAIINGTVHYHVSWVPGFGPLLRQNHECLLAELQRIKPRPRLVSDASAIDYKALVGKLLHYFGHMEGTTYLYPSRADGSAPPLAEHEIAGDIFTEAEWIELHRIEHEGRS